MTEERTYRNDSSSNVIPEIAEGNYPGSVIDSRLEHSGMTKGEHVGMTVEEHSGMTKGGTYGNEKRWNMRER